jgi:hypothetical protein
MASGHVNRANRPNTWLLRPMLRREDSSCQPGAVHTWPLADVAVVSANVRFQGAGSTGRCNTGVKSLCWGFKLQGLTWPFVELTRHSVQMGLRVHR